MSKTSSSSTKTAMIQFIVQGARFEAAAGRRPRTSRPAMTLPVNLDGLSETARRLAHVDTTDHGDDASLVWVRSSRTLREESRDRWDDRTFYRHGCKTWRRYDQLMNAVYGRVWNAPEIIVWHWDALRNSETPEEYLERHARSIQEIGGIVVRAGLTGRWME